MLEFTLLLSVTFLLLTVSVFEKPYKWVVVATFKNESMILANWLKHYIDEGADHLYLIDNGSQDDYMTVLQRFPQQIVTVIRDSSPPMITLQDILMKKYLTSLVIDDTHWVLVVDIDEYVYPLNTSMCIANVLDSFPEAVNRVWLPWKVFGSNGHIEQPNEGIVEGFTKRKGVDHFLGKHALGYGKSFTRVKDKLQLLTHTSNNGDSLVFYSNGTQMLYGDHLAKVMLDEESIQHQALQLNHYMFQSRDYYQRVKCVRGGGQSGRISKYSMDFYDEHEPSANKIEDLGLKQRYQGLGDRCVSKFAVE